MAVRARSRGTTDHTRVRPPFLRRTVPWLVLVLGASPQAAFGQSVRGLLLEQATDRPIALGSVVLVAQGGDTVASGLSDDTGFYALSAPESGRFVLFANALGYRQGSEGPFELEESAVRVVQLVLEPEPIGIPGVGVETERPPQRVRYLVNQGFYDRMRRGFGRFITPEDLQREAPFVIFTEDLFRRIPGVSVGSGGIRVSGTRPGMCSPSFFIDGGRTRVPDLNRRLNPGDIEGIEIYRRPLEVPLQYQGAAGGCGVILIWTKH